jgi:hypothetical protein
MAVAAALRFPLGATLLTTASSSHAWLSVPQPETERTTIGQRERVVLLPRRKSQTLTREISQTSKRVTKYTSSILFTEL